MDQLLSLIEILAVNALVAAPIAGIVLFLGGGADLEPGLPLRYAEPGWPRGVQEEDSPEWHVELAHPRGRSTAPVGRSIVTTRMTQGCELAATR